MAKLELGFLWHMHQPPYRDPETGVAVLPWVRLHATRSYLDMAAMHARFPGVRSTVNFSPCLLEQLEEQAAGAPDRFLELTERSASDLADSERIFLLRHFFMVSWEQGVRPLPRYAELLDKRGVRLDDEAEAAAVARTFSVRELRDLQVLFQLAWMGFEARATSEVVRSLLAKGRDFTEEEKGALLREQRAIVASILPAWRRLWEQGIVELTATPYDHPILPLLCDTDEARVALPDTPLPPRLRAVDDAHEQVRRGLATFERVFGARPTGMWPAEGSVSPEALAVFAAHDVQWVATDEENLLRSLQGRSRDEVLYRPWQVRAGQRDIAVVFRDRSLSDRIGFSYARSPHRQAVEDFFGELQRIATHAPSRDGPPFCAVILDGENPWEHYPQSGEPFLTELFSRLERGDGGVRTTTIGKRIARGLPPGRIERIHSGSWIEGSFRIWIGHQEDVEAWALVGEAWHALAEARTQGMPQDRLEAAHHHLLAAEASDWFWWYGEDFVTESRADFDALFRGHVRAVFRHLGRSPPARAMEPIAGGITSTLDVALPLRAPTGFLAPTIDGVAWSWREWLGAGLFLAAEARGGSMHRGSGLFARVHYGFDPQTLYLRLDPFPGAAPLAESFDELLVSLEVEGRRVELQGGVRGADIRLHDAEGRVAGRGRMRAIVELAIPFEAVGMRAGQRVGGSLRASRAQVEVDRIPAQGWLVFEVPDERFERILWKV